MRRKILIKLPVLMLSIVLVIVFSMIGCGAEPATETAEEPAAEEPAAEEPAAEEPEEELPEVEVEDDPETEVVLTETPIEEPKHPLEDYLDEGIIGAGESLDPYADEYYGEYSYHYFRDQALAGEFDEDYAKDFKFANTNYDASIGLANSITDSITNMWYLAGGKEDNTLVLDNENNPSTMIANYDIIADWGPDAMVSYAGDLPTLEQISMKAQQDDIFILGNAVAVPNFPFFGSDNWANGVTIGEAAVDYINTEWGGIDEVDVIFYAYNPAWGEFPTYRTWGARKAMIDAFGHTADFLWPESIAERVAVVDEYQQPFMDALAKHPEAEKIVVLTPFEAPTAGYYAAATTLGRWDPENTFVGSLGGDEVGRSLVRSGIVDATVGWRTELYGTYFVPMALAHMYGNPVPPFVPNELVLLTQDNLDEHYPGETLLFTPDEE